MKKFKLFIITVILFTSLFMFFSINKTNAEGEIADSAEVNVDAEINQSKTILRFIVTASGVELKKIDEIELILKKDGVPSKKQLFITTVYTSITNASKDYVETENTYYGIVNITDTKILSGSTIEANAKITYTDSSVKTLDNDKIINLPDIPTYVREGDTIYFGRYPQTEEKSDEITAKLNSMVGTPENPLNDSEWLDYGYYISNVKTEYMYYIDIDLNNDSQYDYRGVYFNQYRPRAVDQESADSTSSQDNNGYFINTVYWFKYEPIKWDVLNILEGKAIISSSMLLDAQQFMFANGVAGDTINSHNGYDNRYLSAYDASDIRIWLNNNFYNDAFDVCDKKIINNTIVDNSYDTIGDIERNKLDASTINRDALLGTNTDDYVFLLSYEEVSTYYKTSNSRTIKTTDYCVSQGVDYYSNNKSADWWTRTPSTSLYQACYTTRSGNQVDGTNNTYRKPVTMADGVKPAIIIDLDSYILNVTTNDDLYGSANLIGESTHAYGENITLEALENDGYSFVGWYNNDNLLSNSKTYSFYMPNKNYDVEARFTTYTITTSVDDAEAVSEMTTFDHQNYTAGETVNLSVTLNDGYSFLGWYIGDDLISDKENYSYVMPSSNVEIEARTVRYTLSVDYYLNNGYDLAHKVTFDTNGGSNIDSQYSNNLIYNIPTKEGYFFAGWYDNPNMTGTTFDFSSEINDDITLYARWIEEDSNYRYIHTEKTYVDSKGADFGDYYIIVPYVDGNIDIYARYPWAGSYCTIELYDSSFNLIDSFTVDDSWNYACHNYNVSAGDELYLRIKPNRLWDRYEYHYALIYYNHTLPDTGYDYGTATKLDNQYTKAGSTVKLTAENKNGTTFIGWFNGDELLSSEKSYTFTMPKENLNIYAKFEYYNFTLINDNENAGNISNYNETKIVAGTNVTISATTNDQYSFLGWYDGSDNLISDDINYTFEMPYGNVIYYAKYKNIVVDISKNIDEAGTVSITENLEYGKEAKVTATVKYGYIFTGWYDSNGEKLTGEVEYTFIVGDSNIYEAKYIINLINISLSLDEAGSISNFEFGYVLNDTLELVYTNNPGYTWYGWYLNGNLLSEEKIITIDITNEAKNYVARAEKYVLTISSNINDALKDYCVITYDTTGGSEISPQKSYELEYKIPEKEGYVFAGWYLDSNCEGDAFDFETELHGDITLYAKWIETGYTAFPFNTSRKTRIPTGTYNDPEAWFAFYPLNTGIAHLTTSEIYDYGYRFTVYAADKTTVIKYAEGTNPRNQEYIKADMTFNVEANNVYYLKLEKYYANSGTTNYIKLEVDLPTLTCNTSRNDDIIVAGQNVHLYADAYEGYTFIGWYLDDELITTNNYYSFIMDASSIEYEARYTQNQVTYTVNHYLQNIDDNEYAIQTDDIQIINGLTGDETQAVANTYVGFNAKEFAQAKINGDNSTVIDIYYDRNSYNLTTSAVNTINDSNAGSVNIKNGTYKYYKSVTLVATPNDGYGFIGWYNGENLVSPDPEYTFNMPSNDLNLVAKFEAIEVEYTVEYWLENIYDDNYTYDKSVTLSGYSGEQTEAVATPYSDFVTPSVTQTTINGDGSTTVVIQYKRKTIDKVALEIFFGLYNDNKYGSVVTPDGFTTYSTGYYNDPHRHYSYKENVKVGSVITPSITPNEGYVLEGWYLNNGERIADSELDTFTYTVTQDDVADNAIWLVAKVTTTYKVQYYYQNNVDEWVENGEIIDQGRTYDAESITYDRKGLILENTTESVDTLIEIQDGFEIYNISNIMLDNINEVVNVYCIPKKYKLWFDREYDYVPFPTYDGEMAPAYGEDTYVELYYGQTSKVISTEGPESSEVAFVGWYVVKDDVIYGDALSTELTTTFKMRAMDLVVVPIFSIEYELEVHKDGVVTTETRVGNIGFKITPDYYEGYSVFTLIYYSGSSTLNWYCLQSSNNRVLVEYKKN